MQKRHFYNSAFVKMFPVPTLPLWAVASPWRRGSVPEIIDHHDRLYCGNKRRAPRKDAISIFASGRRNNSSPTKLPRETRPQEYECDFEPALFGAYYRVSIRDAEAEGCPCDCPYYPQRVGQLSPPINRATRFAWFPLPGAGRRIGAHQARYAAYGYNYRHKPLAKHCSLRRT